MFFETNFSYQKKIEPQRGLTMQQTRDLTNFLSLGLDGLSLQKSKQLSRALQIKKQRQIMRQRAMKIMRPLLRGRKLANKIALMLERSGLSLQQQKTLLRQIKKLLLDFNRGVHNQLDLRGINLQMLPLSLRRFIIALQVLKAEIVHLFRLRLALDRKRINQENLPRISKDRYRKRQEPFLQKDFREIYATGVSRTLGSYAGRLSLARRNKNDVSDFERKTTHNRTDFSKKTRNAEQNKSKNYQKYKNTHYSKSNEMAKSNSRDYYRGNSQHRARQ